MYQRTEEERGERENEKGGEIINQTGNKILLQKLQLSIEKEGKDFSTSFYMY